MINLFPEEIFSDLKKSGLHPSFGKTFTGKDIGAFFSWSDLRPTIGLVSRIIERILKTNSSKLSRQIGTRSVAEATIVYTPNASVSLRFGSQKLVEQCLEYLLVSYRYPELVSKLLVDNPGFEKRIDSQIIKLRRASYNTRRDPLLCKVICFIQAKGPRTVGGYETGHFSKLRLVFRAPNKPQRAVRRRGYNDHGSIAPLSTKCQRTVNDEFYSYSQQLLKVLRPYQKVFENLQVFLKKEQATVTYNIQKGYESWEVTPHILSIQAKARRVIDTWFSLNLPVRKLVSITNYELRRGL